MKRVVVIAEAGPNHNGKIKLAYKLIDAAKKCGADFIKFQTSIPELHISKFPKKASYQLKNKSQGKNQLQMCEKFSLSYKEFVKQYWIESKMGELLNLLGLKQLKEFLMMI